MEKRGVPFFHFFGKALVDPPRFGDDRFTVNFTVLLDLFY